MLIVQLLMKMSSPVTSRAQILSGVDDKDATGRHDACHGPVITDGQSRGQRVAMKHHKVLFLCTGNSARSILAEAILNKDGAGRFSAFSAGSQPRGEVHPMALAILDEFGFPTDGYRSKSWEEFATGETPPLDFVFTVCDNAAGEVCPVWPGQPMTAHWGIEDPAMVAGPEQRQAFRNAFYALQRRIGLFLALPLESIDELSLQNRLRDIGRVDRAKSDASVSE
jgi:arsenate reductase